MKFIKKTSLYISGFTLAEVLITLAIIGVVAAIIIPAIINKVEKRDSFSKLQKAIASITVAGETIRATNAGTMEGLVNTDLNMATLFKEHMNTIKFCQNLAESPNCYLPNTADLYSLDGQIFSGITPSPYHHRPKIVTADGFMYWFEVKDSECKGDHYTRNGINENCGNTTVDINGAKPPNTYGKDIFVVLINKFNITARIESTCDKATPGIWNGVGCSGKAIKEGGIYYY